MLLGEPSTVRDGPADETQSRLAPLSARALRCILVAGDVVAVGLPLTVAFGGKHRTGSWPVLGEVFALLFVAIGGLVARGMYRSGRSSVHGREFAAVISTAAWVFGCSLFLDAMHGRPSRWIVDLAAAIFVGVALLAWRSSFRAALRAARRSGVHLSPVAIVGTDSEAARLCRLFADHPDAGFRVVGVFGDRTAARERGLPWKGTTDAAVDAVRRGDANGVVLVRTALPDGQLASLIQEVRACGGYVHVDIGIDVDPQMLEMRPIAHEPMLCLRPDRSAAVAVVAKRVFDVAFACIGMALAAPVLIVAAVAIKVSDGGPVLFRQTRVGRHGTPFTMFKLRTMEVGAEATVGKLLTRNDRSGPLFKMATDPRTTRVGRVLRATDLDEIPQLMNVIRGEMSLVGPRPALLSEVEQFDAELHRRTQVPPGLTGLWQVESRDHPSLDVYRRLDLYYVDNWSLRLDLEILLLTVEAEVSRMMVPIRRRAGALWVHVRSRPDPFAPSADGAVEVE